MSPSEMPRSTQASGRRRPLGAFIIILVLCLVSFSVGIFIGKNNKPSQQQTVLQPQLTHTVARSATMPAPVKKPIANVVVGKDVVAPETATMQSASVAPDNTAVVAVETEENSEVQKEELVGGEIVSEQSPLGNGLNQPEAVTVAVAPVAKEDSAAKVQTKIVKLAPTVEKSSTKLNSSAEYVVQVGSFKKISDAEKVQAKLQSTFAVQVKRADLGQKGIWYRVLVGPVGSVEEAGKVKESLQQKFKLSGFVKKNI